MAKSPSLVRLLAVCSLLITSSGAFGMWVKMSDQELVDSSEIIVKGRLLGASEVTLAPDSKRLRLGAILVKRTYKGSKQDIVFIALPSLLGPKSSIDIDYPTDKLGIWFLRNSNIGAGIYAADNPQRFWPADKNEERIKALFPQ